MVQGGAVGGLGAGDGVEALTRKLLMTIKEDVVSGLGPKMWRCYTNLFLINPGYTRCFLTQHAKSGQ